MDNHNEHLKRLATLRDMAREYHLAFCIVQPGVPAKPQEEREINLNQIYGAARTYGVSTDIVDDMIDKAEKEHARYAPA